MLQIILSLLLTFTGDIVRPLAWMLCTPPLAGHVPPVPMLWLMPPQQYGALGSLYLPLHLPMSAAQRPVSHRGLATAKDSQEATSKWNCSPVMTRVAALCLHRGGIERLTPPRLSHSTLPFMQPHRWTANWNSASCRRKLLIGRDGGKEVAMFTNLFLLSYSLKEFSNT